jgi:hypothetical protein
MEQKNYLANDELCVHLEKKDKVYWSNKRSSSSTEEQEDGRLGKAQG